MSNAGVGQDHKERIDGFFEREVRWLLKNAFTNSDFFTLAETAKYKPLESYDTWMQMKGERDEVVEIYHRGEWLCDVHSGMKRDDMITKVATVLGNKLEAEKFKRLQEEQKQKGVTT